MSRHQVMAPGTGRLVLSNSRPYEVESLRAGVYGREPLAWKGLAGNEPLSWKGLAGNEPISWRGLAGLGASPFGASAPKAPATSSTAKEILKSTENIWAKGFGIAVHPEAVGGGEGVSFGIAPTQLAYGFAGAAIAVIWSMYRRTAEEKKKSGAIRIIGTGIVGGLAGLAAGSFARASAKWGL